MKHLSGSWGIRLAVSLLFLALSATLAFALSIDATNKYAWGENIGWLNWGTAEGAVVVPNDVGELTGYVWGENVGWVSLNCSNTSSCGTVDYKVSKNISNEFTGYAWGENVGWLSFNCSNTASCGTVPYAVSFAPATGEFSGYAWGENIGWVNFNCSNDSSCGAVDFKVMTGETPTPTPASGGGGGFITTPTPATTATPATSPVGATPTPTPSSAVPPATPTVAPPISTPPVGPTGSPPPVRPPGDVVDAVDRFSERLFTNIEDALVQSCGDSGVQAVACGTTTLALLASALSILAILVQSEAAAAAFSMLQIVGLKRRSKVWGVIYDVRTKRPVPLAKVELLDEGGRVLETRFADRDGRYGFLTSPVTMRSDEIRVAIRVSKGGYSFPAASTGAPTDYLVYDHLYFGGVLSLRTDTVLNFNVPLEPVAGGRIRFSGYGLSLIGTIGDKVLGAAFYGGLIAVPVNFYFMPSQKNLLIMVLFFLANAYRLFVVYRPYGITTDSMTGRPMPYSLVTLNALDGTRVGFAVSDEFGRYILSGQSNTSYDITAYSPANTLPQRSTTKRVSHLTRRGWATLKLTV